MTSVEAVAVAVKPEIMDREEPGSEAAAPGVVLSIASETHVKLDWKPDEGQFRSEMDHYAMTPAITAAITREEWDANLAAINGAAGGLASFCSCLFPDAGMVDSIEKCDEINRRLDAHGITVKYKIQHNDETIMRDVSKYRKKARKKPKGQNKVVDRVIRTHWLEVSVKATPTMDAEAGVAPPLATGDIAQGSIVLHDGIRWTVQYVNSNTTKLDLKSSDGGVKYGVDPDAVTAVGA